MRLADFLRHAVHELTHVIRQQSATTALRRILARAPLALADGAEAIGRHDGYDFRFVVIELRADIANGLL